MAEIERVLRYPHIRQNYAIADQNVELLLYSLQAEALVVGRKTV